MPHLIMEFSKNLGSDTELSLLLGELHRELGAADSVDIEAVKSRMYSHDNFFVGADTSRRAFLHLAVKVLPGRTVEWKRALGERLHERMKKKAASLLPSSINCSTTIEFVDLDEATYFRTPRR